MNISVAYVVLNSFMMEVIKEERTTYVMLVAVK
jgi:hypothetical protein